MGFESYQQEWIKCYFAQIVRTGGSPGRKMLFTMISTKIQHFIIIIHELKTWKQTNVNDKCHSNMDMAPPIDNIKN